MELCPAPRSVTTPPKMRALRHVPERCVRGTDWPHTNVTGPMPDDGALLDLLHDWAPGAAVRQKILVDNPATLYRFKP
jgi:2-pyrone-4,6-dicarboxylate lactonase